MQSLTLYIKFDSNRSVLVVDPSYEEGVTALLQIPGVQRANRNLFYHNSTMRAFPQRIWLGQNPISYGIDFGFTSRQALRTFISRLEGVPVAASSNDADQMNVDPRTETEAKRAVRLGQQNFRRALLDFWKGRCALTGLAIPELLRASHIKPWRDSSAVERLDSNNGLLLAVHIDGLFDRGFISFDAINFDLRQTGRGELEVLRHNAWASDPESQLVASWLSVAPSPTLWF